MDILRNEMWPEGARVTLETLVDNHVAKDFFKSVGFHEYCVSLEPGGGRENVSK